MSNHAGIVVSSQPMGRFQEIIVSGTPKPGTCMTMVAATEPVNGVYTMEVFNEGADGIRAPVAVLCEDSYQGKSKTTAYVSGDRGKVYYPQPGDLLQMLLKNISGTSDSFAIKDRLIIDEDTGKLIATTGSPESEPFEVMETVAAITADTLALCKYTGH